MRDNIIIIVIFTLLPLQCTYVFNVIIILCVEVYSIEYVFRIIYLFLLFFLWSQRVLRARGCFMCRLAGPDVECCARRTTSLKKKKKYIHTLLYMSCVTTAKVHIIIYMYMLRRKPYYYYVIIFSPSA